MFTNHTVALFTKGKCWHTDKQDFTYLIKCNITLKCNITQETHESQTGKFGF